MIEIGPGYPSPGSVSQRIRAWIDGLSAGSYYWNMMFSVAMLQDGSASFQVGFDVGPFYWHDIGQ